MVWENTSTEGTVVVAIANGEERSFQYDGSKPLKDVITDVASQMSFGSVLVKADGRNVEPSEGETVISSFKRIEIVPKTTGA
tara:strand:- start:405 stop:650 length:246 start_codon:yes stop_codon:yes gene_type:complete